MKLFLNKQDYVDYDIIEKDDTVQDYLTAIEKFLEENPVPCHMCVNGCCDRGLYIMVDNVAIKRIAKSKEEDYVQFIKENAVINEDLFYLKNIGKSCLFLNENKKCNIYTLRPLVCQVYMCKNVTDRHYLLKHLITHIFGAAGVFEYLLLTQKRKIMNTPIKYKKNPAIFAESYKDVKIIDILDYVIKADAIDNNTMPIFERILLPSEDIIKPSFKINKG